jgi:flagellar basal body-associated protein FliL
MQRGPYKGSSQQSLVIIILIVLIVIAIFVNIALGWFYNRATNSRIELVSEVLIAAQILNGQDIALQKEELFPGAIVERTLRIQKDSEAKNFYVRIKSEIRIDGITTDAIQMQIAEQDSTYWLKEEATGGKWFYAYSDFDTLDQLNDRAPIVHLQFVVEEDVASDRLSRVITNILTVEAVPIDGNISHWQNLPASWPYVPQEQ